MQRATQPYIYITITTIDAELCLKQPPVLPSSAHRAWRGENAINIGIYIKHGLDFEVEGSEVPVLVIPDIPKTVVSLSVTTLETATIK